MYIRVNFFPGKSADIKNKLKVEHVQIIMLQVDAIYKYLKYSGGGGGDMPPYKANHVHLNLVKIS